MNTLLNRIGRPALFGVRDARSARRGVLRAMALSVAAALLWAPVAPGADLRWDTPFAIDDTARFAGDREEAIDVATDGQGRWLVVWAVAASEDSDVGTPRAIRYTRSEDNGETWRPAADIYRPESANGEANWKPSVATDGAGAWVVAWSHTSAAEAESLWYARSTDHGMTWSAPGPLHPSIASGAERHDDVQVAVGAAGAWLAVWSSKESFGGQLSGRAMILKAHSNDDGASWSAPTLLEPYMVLEAADNFRPQIAGDGAGVWVVAWERGLRVGTTELAVSRSVDGGRNWHRAMAPVWTEGHTGYSRQYRPEVATDGRGAWYVTWTEHGWGSGFGSHEYRSMASKDNGGSWQAPEVLPVETFRRSQQPGYGHSLALAANDAGQWAAVMPIADERGQGFTTSLGASMLEGGGWQAEDMIHFDGRSDGDFGTGLYQYRETKAAIAGGADEVWVAAWRRTVFDTTQRTADIPVDRSEIMLAVSRPASRAGKFGVALRKADTHPRLREPVFEVNVYFQVAVDDFDAEEMLQVENGYIQGWRRLSSRSFAVQVAVDGRGPGPIQIQLPENVVTSQSGARNLASNVLIFDYEFAAYVVSLGWSHVSLKEAGPLEIRAVFNTCLESLDPALLQVEHGRILEIIADPELPDRARRFRLLPDGTGPVTFQIPANAAHTCHKLPFRESFVLQQPATPPSPLSEDWSIPYPLDPRKLTNEGAASAPSVVLGEGVHLAAWIADDNSAIRVSRSNDDGEAWSPSTIAVASLEEGAQLSGLQLEHGGGERWYLAWSSNDHPVTGLGETYFAFVSRSDDNGASWTTPVALDEGWGGAINVALTVDRSGRCVAAWSPEIVSGASPPYVGRRVLVLSAYSDDFGSNWSTPQVIEDIDESISQHRTRVVLAPNDTGSIMLLWAATEIFEDFTFSFRRMLKSVRSDDGGQNWSPVSILTPKDPRTRYYRVARDNAPRLLGTATGWLAVWNETAFSEPENPRPETAIFAEYDAAQGSWSPPAAVYREVLENEQSPAVDGLHRAADGTITTFVRSYGVQRSFLHAMTYDEAARTWSPRERIATYEQASFTRLNDAVSVARGSAQGWIVAQSLSGYLDNFLGTVPRIFVSASTGAGLVRPSVVLERRVPEESTPYELPITARFSHGVFSFTAEDIEISNGTVSDFTGAGHEYTFRVTPSAQGEVAIRIPEAAAYRYTGAANLASNTVRYDFANPDRPEVYLSAATDSPIQTRSFDVDAAFSALVDGLGLDDIVVANGVAVSLEGSGATYRFRVIPEAAGAVEVQIRDGAARSQRSGATSLASNTLSRSFAPLGAVWLPLPVEETSANPIPFTIRFEGPVPGLNARHFDAANGIVHGMEGGPREYRILVSPNHPGTVGLALKTYEGIGDDNWAIAPLAAKSIQYRPSDLGPLPWSTARPMGQLEHRGARQIGSGMVVEEGSSGVLLATWRRTEIGADNSVLEQIMLSTSRDAGRSWTPPKVLDDVRPEASFGSREAPTLAYGGNGTWIVAWSSRGVPGRRTGSDGDIFFRRSLDDGETWSPTAPLNQRAYVDTGNDAHPSIATDGARNWLAVWSTNEGAEDGQVRVVLARSGSHGVSWTAPEQLSMSSGFQIRPRITTNGKGVWAVAWEQHIAEEGSQIVVHTSTDNGRTWSGPSIPDTRPWSMHSSTPDLAISQDGFILVVWRATLPSFQPMRSSIYSATSTNLGQSWSGPRPVHNRVALPIRANTMPRVIVSDVREWVVAWSQHSYTGSIWRRSIATTASGDNGQTWSKAQEVFTTDTLDRPDTVHLLPMGQGALGLSIGVEAGDIYAVADYQFLSTAPEGGGFRLDGPQTILSSTAPRVVAGPFTATALFDRPVAGLRKEAIAVNRGRVAQVRPAGNAYYIDIEPTQPGEISVLLPEGATQSILGLASAAAGPITRRYEPAQPPLELSFIGAETTGPTNADSVRFAVFFNRAVRDFDSPEALRIAHHGTSHGSVQITLGPRFYLVTVSGLRGEGYFTIAANTEHTIRDYSEQPLTHSPTSVPVFVDRVAPQVEALRVSAKKIAPGQTLQLDVEASEALGQTPELFLSGAKLSKARLLSQASSDFRTSQWLVEVDSWEETGSIGVAITMEDLAGNVGVHEETDLVAVQDDSGAPLPLRWLWAYGVVLGVAMVWALGRRRKDGSSAK